jgi:hypothetical protein
MDLGVTYIATHLPNHIAADMRHLAEIGCTEVLFALQENHLLALNGALRYGAEIAQNHGLRPYAVIWGYANTFGGGRMSQLMLNHPDLWRVDRDGTRQPKACLNHPRLVDEFERITILCREHGYLGMFVDEPTRQTCFCDYCQAAFGSDLRQADEATVLNFQDETVHRYTAEVCRRVKAVDPALTTITCIMPHDRAVWERVASIPELDVFGSDPYWLLPGMNMTLEQAVDDAQAVKTLCERTGNKSQLWLQGWKIPAGLEAEVYTGGKALAAVGCDSFYTWSFRGGLGTNEESADPYATWDSVTRLYRELSGMT